jgi:hypothetical protein
VYSIGHTSSSTTSCICMFACSSHVRMYVLKKKLQFWIVDLAASISSCFVIYVLNHDSLFRPFPFIIMLIQVMICTSC